MDDYLSDYDNADQMEHIAGGIRYMPIKKESVGKPDYQPLQQQNKGGKHLKQVQSEKNNSGNRYPWSAPCICNSCRHYLVFN